MLPSWYFIKGKHHLEVTRVLAVIFFCNQVHLFEFQFIDQNIASLDLTIYSDLYNEKMFKLMTNITVVFGRLVVCFGTFAPLLLVLNTRIISLRMESCHNRLQVHSPETWEWKWPVIWSFWSCKSSKVSYFQWPCSFEKKTLGHVF